MLLTPLLKNLLVNYQTMLEPDEFASFENEVTRLLKHYYKHLSAFNAGAPRSRELNRLIDEQIELNSQIKTTCQKGCASCCHLEIEITSDEAALLAESIASGAIINYDRLNEQAERSRKDTKWSTGFNKNNACAFLGDDNACTNYENRPSTCRKHAVVSAVQECSTLGAAPVPRVLPMAEIITSSALNLPDMSFASLPTMLKKELEKTSAPELDENISII